MRYFYDWEFQENGTTIIPISLGMVSEDDRELYLVNKNFFNAVRRGELEVIPWLKENVLPHISEQDEVEFGAPLSSFGAVVQSFISDNGKYKSRDEIELWGYFSAYDHVALAQLWGPMINLPKPVPMFTNDLMTISRGRTIAFTPEQEHNSLSDARWNRKVWKTWTDV